MSRWMTIDPGISGTGWARFNGTRLVEWGNIYPKGKDFRERSSCIEGVMGYMCVEHRIIKIFIEWPTGNFSSNAGIAAKNTDAILKLCYLIGKLDKFVSTKLLPVQKWKGQLPKEVVQSRAERFFKKTGFKSHAADAVGIGQYVIQAGLI